MKIFEIDEYGSITQCPIIWIGSDKVFSLTIEVFIEGVPLSFNTFKDCCFCTNFTDETIRSASIIILNCTEDKIRKAIPCTSLVNLRSVEDIYNQLVGINPFNCKNIHDKTIRQLIVDEFNITFRIIYKESEDTSRCFEAWIKNEI